MFATTAAKVQNPTKVNAVSLHSHRSRKTTTFTKRNVSVRAEAQKTIDMNEVSDVVFFSFFCVFFSAILLERAWLSRVAANSKTTTTTTKER
jgi:hypothetical protein